MTINVTPSSLNLTRVPPNNTGTFNVSNTGGTISATPVNPIICTTKVVYIDGNNSKVNVTAKGSGATNVNITAPNGTASPVVNVA